MSLRLLYAAGPGDIVAAHADWENGRETVSEVSRTYSGQIAQFCKELDAEVWIVSSNARRGLIRSGKFVVENRPKQLRGAGSLRYHLSQSLYALSLLRTAIGFRPDVIFVDSGTTHWFMLTAFHLFGIRVIPFMHNALWPEGCPQKSRGLIRRVIRFLDGWFWRKIAAATLGVSTTCLAQARALGGGVVRGPLFETRCQFVPCLFDDIKPPSSNTGRFCVIFAGRINRSKGVFDVVEIAKLVEKRMPGRVCWEMCGDGPDLAALREAVRGFGLDSIIELRGRLNRCEMAQAYARSHAVIVPTRGDGNFCEGLPMVIGEAILSGRPVITSRLSNAFQAAGEALVEVEPHDINGYVAAIERLSNDKVLYQAKQQSTYQLRAQFIDGKMGTTRVLRQALEAIGLAAPSELGQSQIIDSASKEHQLTR